MILISNLKVILIEIVKLIIENGRNNEHLMKKKRKNDGENGLNENLRLTKKEDRKRRLRQKFTD